MRRRRVSDSGEDQNPKQYSTSTSAGPSPRTRFCTHASLALQPGVNDAPFVSGSDFGKHPPIHPCNTKAPIRERDVVWSRVREVSRSRSHNSRPDKGGSLLRSSLLGSRSRWALGGPDEAAGLERTLNSIPAPALRPHSPRTNTLYHKSPVVLNAHAITTEREADRS